MKYSYGFKCNLNQIDKARELGKLQPNNFIYIQDISKLGIINSSRKIQLLVQVEKYDKKCNFPKEIIDPDNNKLYKDESTGLIYYYDRDKNDYYNVEVCGQNFYI